MLYCLLGVGLVVLLEAGGDLVWAVLGEEPLFVRLCLLQLEEEEDGPTQLVDGILSLTLLDAG